MKLSLFEASSKVHTQRNVMRETDQRIASYSRRGILLNVILFIACIMFGEYTNRQPAMGNVLVVGLVLLSAIRGCARPLAKSFLFLFPLRCCLVGVYISAYYVS